MSSAEGGKPSVETPWTSRLRNGLGQIVLAISLMWKAAPWGTLLSIVLVVLSGALQPASAYVGKLIVDAVLDAQQAAHVPGAIQRALEFVLLELGLLLSVTLLDRSLGLVRTMVGARLTLDLATKILKKALLLELRQFEDPVFYDLLTRARREATGRPLGLLQRAFGLLKNGLVLAGYLTLLTTFSAWATLAVLVASVPAFLAEAHFSRKTYLIRNSRSEENRRLNYLEKVLTEEEYVKEVKLFGLGSYLLGLHRDLSVKFLREDRDLHLRSAGWGYLLSAAASLAFYGCYVVVVISTVQGRLSLGEMTLYLVAFRQAQENFRGLLAGVGGMYEDNLYLTNLFEFLAIPPGHPVATSNLALLPAVASRAPADGGIRFEQVSFKHPGSDRYAVRDIDLVVPPGQSLALVGENGAGKTTIIKLLTRLYSPTEGRILLDGRDLRDWDEVELRSRIGVIFQDFNQYQFRVRENIAVGSIARRDDDLRVKRAMEEGGARAVVAGLPHGLDTQLGRKFRDGVGLSGGQWQKIALARAFMRQEADILILDEPTAALDALAEHAIFDRFRELTRGRTAIIVSHRFPTVRMADRIVVVREGMIAENGSHGDLLKAGGRYAELFELQAQGYR